MTVRVSGPPETGPYRPGSVCNKAAESAANIPAIAVVQDWVPGRDVDEAEDLYDLYRSRKQLIHVFSMMGVEPPRRRPRVATCRSHHGSGRPARLG